jgi:hypothetical protein
MSCHRGDDVQYRMTTYTSAAQRRAMMIGIRKGNGDHEPKIREISQYKGGHITIAAGVITQGDGGICEATGVRWILRALYVANARSAIPAVSRGWLPMEGCSRGRERRSALLS